MLNGALQVGVVGVAGGVVMEIYRLYEVREKSLEEVSFCTSWLYWIVTALMVCCGGVLAIIYGTDNVHPMYVFHIGATTNASTIRK